MFFAKYSQHDTKVGSLIIINEPDNLENVTTTFINASCPIRTLYNASIVLLYAGLVDNRVEFVISKSRYGEYKTVIDAATEIMPDYTWDLLDANHLIIPDPEDVVRWILAPPL